MINNHESPINHRKPLKQLSENQVNRSIDKKSTNFNIFHDKLDNNTNHDFKKSINNESNKEIKTLKATIKLLHVNMKRLQQENAFLRLYINQNKELANQSNITNNNVNSKILDTTTPKKRRLDIKEEVNETPNNNVTTNRNIFSNKKNITYSNSLADRLNDLPIERENNIHSPTLSNNWFDLHEEETIKDDDNESNNLKSRSIIDNEFDNENSNGISNDLHNKNNDSKANTTDRNDKTKENDKHSVNKDSPTNDINNLINKLTMRPSKSNQTMNNNNISNKSLKDRIDIAKSNSMKLLFKNVIEYNKISPTERLLYEYESNIDSYSNAVTAVDGTVLLPLGDNSINVPITDLSLYHKQINKWRDTYQSKENKEDKK